MTNGAAAVLARGKMGGLQVAGVILCVLLLALDGFDVLSISFASPGIAKEWGIDRAALGLVLSMELIGMAAGSIALGALADRIGRKPTILGCLVVMVLGMLAASQAHDVTSLSLYRLATGVGIGGILAGTNAMVAELASAKWRNVAVAAMASGYPIGAASGGTVASLLLAGGDWRAVFLFGAAATAVMIPLVLLLLPESVSFLEMRGGENALGRVNRILTRMGHAPVQSLSHTAGPRASIVALFGPGLALTTILLTAGYFAHIMTFYFILKWVPKIVADMGFTASQAGGVLVWANVGGACGALLITALVRRFDLRILVVGALLLAFGMVTLFGQIGPDLHQIALLAGAAGFCTNAAVVGIYALVARSYPTDLRAGGTGFVIGIGRGGAALGPIIAGLLFQAQAGLGVVALAMAAGSLIAAFALWFLPRAAEPAL